jgi:intraflagellar transport protein 88
MLHSRVLHDPGVLARLGSVHSKHDDEAKALHYYSEAHRVYPVGRPGCSFCNCSEEGFA